MALIWPSTLQQSPLVSGFSHQRQPNLITSPTETGPGKTRPRQTQSPIDVSCSVILDTGQKNLLQTFYEDNTQWGSWPFAWAGLDNAIDGKGHGHRLVKPPKYSPFGCDWKVDLQVQSWSPSGDVLITLRLHTEGLSMNTAANVTFYADFEEQLYIVEI